VLEARSTSDRVWGSSAPSVNEPAASTQRYAQVNGDSRQFGHHAEGLTSTTLPTGVN
jgi:hypothetical protein